MFLDTAVIVGDLVDGPVERLGKAAEIIKNIKVKGDKFFATGKNKFHFYPNMFLSDCTNIFRHFCVCRVIRRCYFFRSIYFFGAVR